MQLSSGLKNQKLEVYISKDFCILLIIFFIMIFSVYCKSYADDDLFYLTQKTIINEAKTNSAAIENIRAKFLESKLNKHQYLENFQARLDAYASYFETNDDNFIQYAPVISPISKLSLGASKDFVSGFSLGLYNNIEKRKYKSFGSDAYNYISLEFTVDLYKNFFGKDSKSRISYLKYEEDLAKIQKEVDLELFLISVYRKYMEILLNREAIKISQRILKNYQIQERDMNQRYKNGIADLSDVRRSSSQIHSQNVKILTLLNKEESLFLDLRNLIPSISNKKIELEDYDFAYYENHFLKIIDDIKSKSSIPLQYTKYDDVLDLLYKSYNSQKSFTKNYDNLDVQFYSNYNHFGNDRRSQEALRNIYEDPKNSYEAGIKLNIPIGKSKKESKDIMLEAQRSAFLFQERSNIAKIESYHIQSINNIEILRQSQISQKKNSKDLKQIRDLSKKKYQQARISIRDLIDDQDLYFQSLLAEIDIKYIIINQILDYMTIFTTTPFALSDG